MCSLIHKFGKKNRGKSGESDYAGFIEELKRSLPENFSPKGDFYVFVDECHRTQSGKLHKAMETILPNATFIGFTGTPLMKKDKETSLRYLALTSIAISLMKQCGIKWFWICAMRLVKWSRMLSSRIGSTPGLRQKRAV